MQNERDRILRNKDVKPDRVAVDFGSIPDEIKKERRWVVWEYLWRGNSWVKFPHQKANLASRDEWLEFEEAKKLYESNKKYSGIGFCLGDGFAGVDFDSCHDLVDGTEELQSILVRQLNSYTEISPTGTGVKVLVRVKKAGNSCKCEDPDIEVYFSDRYFTITGNIYDGAPKQVNHAGEKVQEIIEDYIKLSTSASGGARPCEASPAIVADALAHLTEAQADDYKTWIDVGLAAKSHSEELYDAWVAWSAKSKLFSEAACREKWDSFKPTRISAEFILRRAVKQGWRKPGRPAILVTTEESRVVDQVCKYLGKLGTNDPEIDFLDPDRSKDLQLFVRGGELVEIEHVRGSSPRILPIKRNSLRSLITTVCDLNDERMTKTGPVMVPMHPPEWLTPQVMEGAGKMFRKHFRSLSGVVTSPTFRPDGTLIQREGYDPATRLYYSPSAQYPPIPEHPSPEEIQAAVAKIDDLLCDFPFASDDDKAAWYSMLFSLLARDHISGNVPLFAISANSPGCGKSSLTDLALGIAYGYIATKSSYTNDVEMKKTILSMAMQRTPCVVLDNVATAIGGEGIEMALTAGKVQGRVLGRTEMSGEMELNTVWIATGNNLRFNGDCVRRVICCRLETNRYQPQNSSFKHVDIIPRTIQSRTDYVVAVLTILRGFFAAGSPQLAGPIGSFESWSKTVRNAIIWAGIGDPGATQEHARVEDESEDTLRLLIEALESLDPIGEGLSAGELLSHSDDIIEPNQALLEAISNLCGSNGRHPKSLSAAIRPYVKRPVEGKRINVKIGKWKVKHYFVEPVPD